MSVPTRANIFARSVEMLANYAGYVAAAVVIGLGLLVGIDALLRYTVRRPILGADEVSAWIFVIISYLGLAYVSKQGMHIRVTTLIDRFPPRTKTAFNILNLVLTLAFVIIIGYYFSEIVWVAWQTKARLRGTLELLQAPIQVWVLVGLFLYFLALIKELDKK